MSAWQISLTYVRTNSRLRTYTIYITYTPYYRTPRLYLSGYTSSQTGPNTKVPLPPQAMMEDIMGDYKDKTVTLEDFPFTTTNLKMASVHPCRHASVMKVLLDRADAALKLRMARIKEGKGRDGRRGGVGMTGLEGLVDDTAKLRLTDPEREKDKGHRAGVAAAGGNGGDEWEVLQHEPGNSEDYEVAIRVDQYLVVFLKFIASVTPSIEHDFTMGI